VEIHLNGEPRSVDEGTTLDALLNTLAIRRAGTAVERNEEVIPKSEYATTTLRQGDRLEIVTMLGGG
jgi:thiamine biosynthesis protein ThiS